MYENSPLADYLQGKAKGERHFALRRANSEADLTLCAGEGEANAEWIVPESAGKEDAQSPADTTPSFAPRGTSKFRERIRSKLPKPLDLKSSRRSIALHQFCDTVTVWKTILRHPSRCEPFTGANTRMSYSLS